MYHLIISLVVALSLVSGGTITRQEVLVVLYAAVLGVAIDLDHLLIARKNNGNWDVLRLCVTNPKKVLVEQDELMDPSDVPKTERLVSHAVITTVLVGGLLAVGHPLAIPTLAVLSAHLVADVIADVFPELPFSPGSNGS